MRASAIEYLRGQAGGAKQPDVLAAMGATSGPDKSRGYRVIRNLRKEGVIGDGGEGRVALVIAPKEAASRDAPAKDGPEVSAKLTKSVAETVAAAGGPRASRNRKEVEKRAALRQSALHFLFHNAVEEPTRHATLLSMGCKHGASRARGNEVLDELVTAGVAEERKDGSFELTADGTVIAANELPDDLLDSEPEAEPPAEEPKPKAKRRAKSSGPKRARAPRKDGPKRTRGQRIDEAGDVSLRADGSVRFPSGALEGFARATVEVDGDAMALVIAGAAEGGVIVRRAGKRTARVGAAKALKAHGFDFAKDKGRYPLEERDGAYVIDLSEGPANELYGRGRTSASEEG